MMLDSNGKPYRCAGTSQQFAPGSKQFDLFNLWDQEAIRRGGSPVYYYPIFISTGEIDTDYWESRGKIIANHPIELWANYEPMPAQNFQNAFGIDSLNEIVLECNAKAVLKAVGHMPKVGARIHTPHLGDDWEIIQRNLGEFKMWGALRVQLICRQWQESVTTQSGRVTEKSPAIPPAI